MCFYPSQDKTLPESQLNCSDGVKCVFKIQILQMYLYLWYDPILQWCFQLLFFVFFFVLSIWFQICNTDLRWFDWSEMFVTSMSVTMFSHPGLSEYPYHFYCSNHDVMVPSELLAGFWLRRPRTCYAMLNSLSKGYNPRNGLYSFLL